MLYVRLVLIFASLVVQSLARASNTDFSSLQDYCLNTQGLKDFSCAHTQVLVYNGLPSVKAFFEHGSPSNKNLHVSRCVFLEFDGDGDTLGTQSYQTDILNLNGTVLHALARSETVQTLCIELADSNGTLRRLDWFDKQSGFIVERALLDLKGNVLQFDRFSRVSLNQGNGLKPIACEIKDIRALGMRLEKSQASLNEQVAEMEDYCDRVTTYMLQQGATDLSGSATYSAAALHAPAASDNQSQELSGGKNLLLFPNPAQASLAVLYRLKAEEQVKLLVSDLTGKNLQEMDLGMQSAGTHSYSLDLSSLSSGVYLLTCALAGEENETFQEKFAVKK